MTLEKAIKILELNVPFSRSPEASQIKEAIEIVKFALGQKNIEIHLEEAFMKECECEIESAKEQAVREFAEKLKEQAVECDVDFNYSPACHIKNIEVVEAKEIDKLVNEMFGNPEQVKGEENAEIKPC